jgi:hypothetical protein
MNEAASSVEPEVNTRLATVADAAFEKFLYEKDAKKHQKRHRVGPKFVSKTASDWLRFKVSSN